MDDYTYYEDVEGVAPCEFCGKLIALMDLIQHESGHLVDDEDVYEYPLLDDLIQPEIVFPEIFQGGKSEPKIALEEKQTSSSATKNENKAIAEKKIDSPVSKNKSEIEAHKAVKIKEFTTKSEVKIQQAEKTKEFIKKSDEKLFQYDPVEDIEPYKDEYKMPNNPILKTVPKEKDEEDINNLSDDDSSESLEEFWKRARDYLKRNRVKVEC